MGLELCVSALTERPRLPTSLLPQQATPPPAVRPQLKMSPAVIAATAQVPVPTTGTWDSVVDPFPSSPSALYPQHSTVPARFRAQVWKSPMATPVTSRCSPLTGTGVDRLSIVPSPSCPVAL